jgi:hypothetical protein
MLLSLRLRLMLCLLLRTNSEPEEKTLNRRHRLVEDLGDYDVSLTAIATAIVTLVERMSRAKSLHYQNNYHYHYHNRYRSYCDLLPAKAYCSVFKGCTELCTLMYCSRHFLDSWFNSVGSNLEFLSSLSSLSLVSLSLLSLSLLSQTMQVRLLSKSKGSSR